MLISYLSRTFFFLHSFLFLNITQTFVSFPACGLFLHTTTFIPASPVLFSLATLSPLPSTHPTPDETGELLACPLSLVPFLDARSKTNINREENSIQSSSNFPTSFFLNHSITHVKTLHRTTTRSFRNLTSVVDSRSFISTQQTLLRWICCLTLAGHHPETDERSNIRAVETQPDTSITRHEPYLPIDPTSSIPTSPSRQIDRLIDFHQHLTEYILFIRSS